MTLANKGFILTMDAAIAVLIALLMILGSIFYLSQNSLSYAGDSMYYYCIDSLAVLEKSGSLASYTSTGRPGGIEALVDNMPYQVCAKLDILSENPDGTSLKLYGYQRAGCDYPVNYAVARRVFTSGGGTNLAELEVWRR